MGAADAAFWSWRRTTPAQRQRAMLDLANLVEAHAEELLECEVRNTGKPRPQTRELELLPCIDQLRFFAGAARVLHGMASAEYEAGFTSSIRREPVGVVSQVTPWNYPLMMAIWKIAPAIAAGNTVVLKPADTTPWSTVRLAELAQEVLPPGVLNVVCGDRDTGRALVEHPRPDMVAITGSTRAGSEVMKSAADTLKNVHLELGGKAPALVFEDADLAATADAIATAGFYNAGQDCTAATRVLVQESVHDEFAGLLADAAKRLRVGAPDDGADYGAVNSRRPAAAGRGVPVPAAGARRGRWRAGPATVRATSWTPPSSPGCSRTTTWSSRRSSGRSSPCSPSPTRRRACGWPTTSTSRWPPASGPATTAACSASPPTSTSGSCG